MVVPQGGAENRCRGQCGRDPGYADHDDRLVGDLERRGGHRVHAGVTGPDQRHRETVPSPGHRAMGAFFFLSQTR